MTDGIQYVTAVCCAYSSVLGMLTGHALLHAQWSSCAQTGRCWQYALLATVQVVLLDCQQ
jgi:hypothetical protein